MSLSTPSPPMRGALNDLRASVRTLGDPSLVPPTSLDSDDAVRRWAQPVAPRLAQHRARHDAAITRARHQLDAAQAAEPFDVWRQVDDAFSKLEAEFASSPALKARLSEGRRSMSAKAERVVQENLSASVELTGNRAEAALDPSGVRTLQDALPRWVLGWADYSLRAYEVDLHRLLDRLWLARDAELPVPRPTFSPLPSPRLPKAPDFPTVTQTIDLEGIGGVVKHARSVLYGVMSLGFIFGLRSASSSGGGMNVVMVVAALAAVAFGYVQHRSEQSSRIERFEADVGKRAEQAVKSVLSTWYDRQNDKLLEHCAAQLHERRSQLVLWYRTDVAPRKARHAAEAVQRKAQADAARKQLAELDRQSRELDRAEGAVKRILGA